MRTQVSCFSRIKNFSNNDRSAIKISNESWLCLMKYYFKVSPFLAGFNSSFSNNVCLKTDVTTLDEVAFVCLFCWYGHTCLLSHITILNYIKFRCTVSPIWFSNVLEKLLNLSVKEHSLWHIHGNAQPIIPHKHNKVMRRMAEPEIIFPCTSFEYRN